MSRKSCRCRPSVWRPDAPVPTVVVSRNGDTARGEVPPNTNLVVKAGVRQFPHPVLRYGCGMGKCAKCACRVASGAEHLAAPNWKEQRILGEERLAAGYRLVCQLWIEHDIALEQDAEPLIPSPPRLGST